MSASAFPNGTRSAADAPWYRHRWPWILMIGPAFVMVAGAYTMWLATTSYDGLVADDYYKRGLAVNQTLGRVERASALGLEADIAIDAGNVRVVLASEGKPYAAPAQMQLRLVHATRAGLDRGAALAMGRDGSYTGRIEAPHEGRWRIFIEAADWRLSSEWLAGREAVVQVHLAAPGAVPSNP